MATYGGRRVAIFGGGVGGLSAAHELAERGFQVTVYENHTWLGGKAASQFIPGTGTGGRRDLPGEHGFRFYPGFYRNLVDTMARIPTEPGRSVADRLLSSDEAGVAAEDDRPILSFPRRKSASLTAVVDGLQAAFQALHPTEADMARFAWRILVYLTSCRERRSVQYEQMSWWDFLEGDKYSAEFGRYVKSVPRTMVSMKCEEGSAWTIGDISMQLILDYGERESQNDRTLDGPTSERWLEPWEAHLRRLGVQFVFGNRLRTFEITNGRVSGALLLDGSRVSADWYIAALPVGALQKIVTPELAALDPKMARLKATDVNKLTAWMSGAQYFLRQDVPMVRGHVFYPDSEWALTSISVGEFWASAGRPFERLYGDGVVHGMLTVDIADWTTKSRHTGRSAMETPSADAILDEVWRQLKAGLNTRTTTMLRDENVVSRHLDRAVWFPESERGRMPYLHAPLLVSPPGSWSLRPSAASKVPNLFLASDWVRTETKLASMEGANEAARRAVNALLDRCGSSAPRARTWGLDEPAIFDRAKEIDRERFSHNKPHLLEQVEDLGERLASPFRRQGRGGDTHTLSGVRALERIAGSL